MFNSFLARCISLMAPDQVCSRTGSLGHIRMSEGRIQHHWPSTPTTSAGWVRTQQRDKTDLPQYVSHNCNQTFLLKIPRLTFRSSLVGQFYLGKHYQNVFPKSILLFTIFILLRLYQQICSIYTLNNFCLSVLEINKYKG